MRVVLSPLLFAAALVFAAFSPVAVAGPSAADAIAQKFAEPAKTAQQRADEQRAADEKDMLARAKAEAEARHAADVAAAKAAAPVIPATTKAGASAPPQQLVTAEATPAVVKPAENAAVSILLVLNPGQSDEKRAQSKASPVLCFDDSCFVSSGAAAAAKALPRAEATKAGGDAGACVSKSRCVFRGVALPVGAFVQIVDLGPAKLVRMETVEARPDRTCQVADGTLDCQGPMTAPDYRMWIVPEATAEKAGVPELESAVADELPEENIPQVSDK